MDGRFRRNFAFYLMTDNLMREPTDFEKVEELLRTELYTTLLELGFAPPEKKIELAKRLKRVADKLHTLIVHGQLPDP